MRERRRERGERERGREREVRELRNVLSPLDDFK